MKFMGLIKNTFECNKPQQYSDVDTATVKESYKR